MALKEKKKTTNTKKQNIYLNPDRKRSPLAPPVPSLLVKRVSKTGWRWLRLLYIYR